MTTMTKARRREILTHWRTQMMLWDARRELVHSALELALGRKGHEACARASDKLRPIRTVAQLARLIEVDA